MKALHRLRWFRLVSFFGVAGMIMGFGHAAETTPAVSPDSAWELLAAGNARFVTGRVAHPDQSATRRREVAKAQHPFALILTCADSRVSPEIFFDQGLGDLFVVRNAGNVVDDHVLGSIEYAVEHLGVGLIVVVGHSKCGAVSAALSGGPALGHIESIVKVIAPAIHASAEKAGDKLDNAVNLHACIMADCLRTTGPILAEAVKRGTLRVVAAKYDIASGRVDLLEGAAPR